MRDLRMNVMNSAGQAIVELAIVLLLLLFLVLGIFEFGRAMYTKNTLTHAARAGARAAVVSPNLTSNSAPANKDCQYDAYDPNNSSTYNSTSYAAACNSIYQGIPRDGNTVISVTVPQTPPKSGDMVTVKVTFVGFNTVVPNFLPIPNNLTLTGETAMRYE